ncbi:MAG TPA: AAA family ATPase [Bryobacteraceae bacterium]|nr:AAA family ATPase [Bryobacteraceae bacterium]
MSTIMIRSIPNFQSGSGAEPKGPRLVTVHHHGSASANTIEFPPFRLDTVNQCLWRRGANGEDERVPLKPKPFAILRYLVDHAGRLVTQDELLDAVWPDTHVQPEVLKRHMFEIREVLGDDPRNPTYIETLARRGYQFIAPVRHAAPAEPRTAEIPARTKIVGRDQQLGDLRTCLQKALGGGQRQIVFVTGEPGIGKTTLVDEFQRQASAAAPIRVARGQCVEGYGGKEAYYPVLEALSSLCRGTEGDSVVRILGAQAPTWLVQFPALVRREQREMLQREIQGATRQRMLREICEALETITSEKPLLLVLEDLNWTDPSTVDFISALARGRGAAKLMVIGTYRPAEVLVPGHPLKAVKQDLLLHQLCRKLALEPLREEEISAYLAGASPDATVPDGLAALLHRRSEGNPLYMVAALDHMSQRGFISRENGSWRLNVPIEEIDLEVPESLRQMIELQIEQLSKEELRALEAASVTGTVFSAALSAGAANMDVEHFESLCEGLARRHYIVRSADVLNAPDASDSERYEFVHALYREVLYRRQSPGHRAKLHRQVAGRLETIHAQGLSDAAAELAHHFDRAGDALRATEYRRLAAAKAAV